jgi:acyl-coenzyme A synthetase/AMP-(fatty) acid ligase
MFFHVLSKAASFRKRPQTFRAQSSFFKDYSNNFYSTFRTDIHTVYNQLLDESINQSNFECNFISQIVDNFAQQEPNRLAIRCIDYDSSDKYFTDITYSELVRHSQQIAHFLKQKGIKQGDSIALMLGQQPAWWYSLAGLMRAGISIVPFPRLLTPKDLTYRINDLSIKGIITTPELQDRINSIRAHCPTLKVLVTTGNSSVAGWVSFPNMVDYLVETSSETTTTKDPCLYLYTSGTTGQPKAVQHNFDYPFFHWPTGKRWLRATPNDLVYNASDTGWGFTVWITMAVWSMNAKLLITPTNKKFNPQEMLALLRDQPISIFCAAPTVLRLLVAESNFHVYNFSRLKRIVTVGEALDETVIKQFESKGIEVAVGFGQAETPLLIGRVDNHPHVSGTMGRQIYPYQVVILDEQLHPLPPGETGQIAVDLNKGKRGGIMRGYFNAPERTKKVFSSDGRYYLTGDWAKYSSEGFFIYQGRKDDLIKSKGYRIGPDEVEKAGMSHPAVAKIAVIGIRTNPESHDITVKAFILLKPGYTETLELIQDIQDHIKNETAPNKYPRLVEFLELEEWEKYETTSGKIRRAALREREEAKLNPNVSREDEDSELAPSSPSM